MSENTQPESAAKVEEIAQQIAEAGFHRDCGNHSPRVIESELEDIESILRPYIPSQPNHAERMLELLAKRVGYSNQDEGLINFIVNKLAAPVTPVSGPESQPPTSVEVKGEIMSEHAKEVLELCKLFEFDKHLCVGHRKGEGFHVEFICLDPEDVRKIAGKLDMKSLRLQGQATDHIWLMEDGPESHPIGVRLDCGDSGVVYLSRTQAKDLAEQLTDFAVAPVSGNGPKPPQISNNGACSCCGTKLVRQELTLPHYVDWCSNCQTWAGAQPTPKVEEK